MKITRRQLRRLIEETLILETEAAQIPEPEDRVYNHFMQRAKKIKHHVSREQAKVMANEYKAGRMTKEDAMNSIVAAELASKHGGKHKLKSN